MSEDPARYVCPNCSAGMDGLKCKIRCPRCGYFESCSDLEPAPPWSTPPPPRTPARRDRD